MTSAPELGSTDANGIVLDARVYEAIADLYGGSSAGDSTRCSPTFVHFRNFVEAPRLAGYDIYEAFLTGNAATIDAALQTGLSRSTRLLHSSPSLCSSTSSPRLGGSP